jgi:hypothetical protein
METQQRTHGRLSSATPVLLVQPVERAQAASVEGWVPDGAGPRPGNTEAARSPSASELEKRADAAGTVAVRETGQLTHVVATEAAEGGPMPEARVACGKTPVRQLGLIVHAGSRWWLLAGAILVATTTAFGITTLFVRWLTYGGLPDGESPPLWVHGAVAEILAWLSLALATLVLPLVIGILARSWIWVGVCPVLVFATVFLSGWLGGSLAESRYERYFEPDLAHALLFLFALVLLPMAAGITAVVGSAIGKAQTEGRPMVNPPDRFGARSASGIGQTKP